MKIVPPEIETWTSVDLTDVQYIVSQELSKLRWYDYKEKCWVSATCSNVVFFKACNAFDSMMSVNVADIYIKDLKKEIVLSYLRDRGYDFGGMNDLKKMKHIHAEGSNMLDIICEHIVLEKTQEMDGWP